MTTYISSSTKTTTVKQTTRPDGRAGGGTLRPLACEIGCLHRADGSARFSAGQTSLLAAVYGPSAPRVPAREHPTRATVFAVFRHGNKGGGGGGGSTAGGGGGGGGGGTSGAKERELERFVQQSVSSCIALEEYPRTVIEIVVQVLKADGSVVGAALNAAVVALMDAGVAMRSLPIATTCLVDSSAAGGGDAQPSSSSAAAVGELRLDPTAEEEARLDASVAVLVTDSVRRGVIASLTAGTMAQESYLSCVEAASRASGAVLEFMRLAVEQKVTREAQTLWVSMKDLSSSA